MCAVSLAMFCRLDLLAIKVVVVQAGDHVAHALFVLRRRTVCQLGDKEVHLR